MVTQNIKQKIKMLPFIWKFSLNFHADQEDLQCHANIFFWELIIINLFWNNWKLGIFGELN